MNITTLLHAIRDAVHDDSATQTWCTTNYGRNHKVLVGVDSRNPPDSDQYPMVHIFPVQKTVGYDQDAIAHEISITVGVFDENTLTTAKANVVEMRGISYLEAFRKLVETAALSALDESWYAAEIAVEYETIEFYPFFLANVTILVVIPIYAGGDPFA